MRAGTQRSPLPSRTLSPRQERNAFVLMSSFVQAQSSLPAGTWRVTDAPPEFRYPISRADLIVVSMHDALLRELNDALEQGGPAFAIHSCHIDVVSAIQRIGRQEGIAAGRTGDRLRNPTNAPRAWAAPLVKANRGLMARDVEGFAVDLGDKVGVLRPIAERPTCACRVMDQPGRSTRLCGRRCWSATPRIGPLVLVKVKSGDGSGSKFQRRCGNREDSP
jgi:hypothetical protein